MIFQGHVQNGVIVPDSPIDLANGVKVEIHVLPLAADGLPEVNPLMEFCGIFDDMPSDASRRVDDVLYGIKRE